MRKKEKKMTKSYSFDLNRILMLMGRIIKLNAIVNLPGTESKARSKLMSIIAIIIINTMGNLADREPKVLFFCK